MFALLWLVSLSVSPVLTRAQPAPVSIPWSPKSYGPDGPWQAVRFQFGEPATQIDAYPGGVFFSVLFSPEICDQPESGTICSAREAGLYRPESSKTAVNISNALQVVDETFHGTQTLHGNAGFVYDTLFVPEADIELTSSSSLVVTRGYKTLPSGRTYSARVGNLALGAPDHNMTLGDGHNGTLVSSALYEKGRTKSNSFGLHIGSAAAGIPGSLYFGGYDRSRVIGPVSVQEYSHDAFPIDLLDVTIGEAVAGTSPLGSEPKAGLLSQGNSSLSSGIRVEVDPKEPYLYLPDSSCRAIASHLPVSFNADLGLYIWDTADNDFGKLTSSAYLGFKFRLSDSPTETTEIKVPLKLLNLTLTAPLVEQPTQYFPCSLPSLDGTQFRLGRAFMQAAFIGANWKHKGTGVWFLAQAPGPSLPGEEDPIDIGDDDESITAAESIDWEATWKGHWGASLATGSEVGDGKVQEKEKSGPDVGVIVGAVVGSVIGVVILIIAGLFIRKRMVRRKVLRHGINSGIFEVGQQQVVYPFVPQRAQAELSSEIKPVELEGSTPHRYP